MMDIDCNTTARSTRTNYLIIWSLSTASFEFLHKFRCWVMTTAVWRNDNPTNMCSIAKLKRSEFLMMIRYDPSSCNLNSFMAFALVIGSESSSSSSFLGLKNIFPISSTMIGCDIANVRLSRSLLRNALIPVASFLLNYDNLYIRESMVFRPFISMLRLYIAFITFKTKWKLEQWYILCALPLNGAIALLMSYVHVEHALNCHNGSIWCTLNGSEAEFNFMFFLKEGLVIHDTQKW